MKQPAWCEHSDCVCIRKITKKTCGGLLPGPMGHDGGFNIYRICEHNQVFNRKKYLYAKRLDSKYVMKGTEEHLFNDDDIEWLGWLIDGLQRAYKKQAKKGRSKSG